MDLSQLPKLGKVAGVPGIALYVIALVLGAVVDGSGALPEGWRGPIWLVLVVGMVAIGILAVGAGSRARGARAQAARAIGTDNEVGNEAKGKAEVSQSATAIGRGNTVKNISG